MQSICEIARMTGVSPATVSRALNPALRHKVRQDTLRRILEYCEANSYYGNLAARTLASGKTYCIGLVLSAIENDFASPFFALQISGIMNVLSHYGYTLKLIPVSHGALEQVDQAVHKALLSHEVDGFILSSSMIADKTLAELKKHMIPAIILTAAHLQPEESDILTLGINNRSGFGELCSYLEAAGITRLALLGGDKGDFRIQILKEEARRKNVEVTEFMFTSLAFTIPQQMHEMYLEVKRNWNSLCRFRAWHCVTDLWALGALSAKNEIAPDQDIFISGYDNMEENANYSSDMPAINTIDPFYRRFGEMAAELLFQSSSAQKLYLLDSKFILRKTLQNSREE